MAVVRFEGTGIGIEVETGCTILEAERRAGLSVDAPCGGKGTCGKCAVVVNGETVLACGTEVTGDITVKLPEAAGKVNVLTDSSGAESFDAGLEPMVRCLPVTVHRCSIGESTSDWDRLKEAVKAAGGPCEPAADIKLASRVGTLLKGQETPLWAVCSDDRILAIDDKPVRVLMAAFDIGTTTIAGYLLDAHTGKSIAERGMLNPQTRYGGDVISRIDYAAEHGVDELTSCVREAVNTLLGELCADADAERRDVYAVSVVGNTCMHHMFLGILPSSLVKTPYNPTISEEFRAVCADCGIEAAINAQLLVLPVIAGFVGADTVGCMVSESYDAIDECTLMIDIGTNGELVLGDKHRRIACSTAAGPAFEGAKISMGMRGAPGAVDHAWVNEDGSISYHVIGDVPAKGICGSGLIDIIAALLKAELIDETGRFEDSDSYCLEGSAVSITQKDIREVQLAKAAICAGIKLMTKKLGLTLRDIRRVRIAGAFGCYMDPVSACAIGLIPGELLDRITPAGNAAGAGACRALISLSRSETARRLARDTEFLELATLPEFQDTYVDELMFGDGEDE